MVTFMLTCLRSEAKGNSFLVGSCNPDRTSWLYELIQWYLDDDGFPDQDKIGKVRYYVVHNNDFVFADEEGWFKEHMPDAVTNLATGEYVPPSTFCFIQLSVFDNHILLKKNPKYLSILQNLPKHERDKQLYG